MKDCIFKIQIKFYKYLNLNNSTPSSPNKIPQRKKKKTKPGTKTQAPTPNPKEQSVQHNKKKKKQNTMLKLKTHKKITQGMKTLQVSIKLHDPQLKVTKIMIKKQ